MLTFDAPSAAIRQPCKAIYKNPRYRQEARCATTGAETHGGVLVHLVEVDLLTDILRQRVEVELDPNHAHNRPRTFGRAPVG